MRLGVILTGDARRDARAVAVPTLLIRGENDPVISFTSANLLWREIPDCLLLLMRGTSHVPMFERPGGSTTRCRASLKGSS